jgi:hypothetical protein
MKIPFKSIMLVTGLALGFIGCATDAPTTTDDPAQASTGETEQDIGGGGGSCPAKDNCYGLCRFVHDCAHNGAQCAPLSACLNQCDAEFPQC